MRAAHGGYRCHVPPEQGEGMYIGIGTLLLIIILIIIFT
jgi:hypothetical protein